ncbi:hypothetical protein FQA47_024838 [Oryzias melastigma]|uniref:Uncharacterized protein n=1 Tax=Oryzias melastigma TaxID=30732 RepID=A0A834FKR0_ORYME|nr:hypothetical protein FQA47_024838 [Oryzias melastigma]
MKRQFALSPQGLASQLFSLFADFSSLSSALFFGHIPSLNLDLDAKHFLGFLQVSFPRLQVVCGAPGERSLGLDGSALLQNHS